MLVNIFTEVLLVSIMASLLIVLILLAKTVFKEKLSARWHYYIWLLLIIRLVIPYTPEFSVNLNDLFPWIRDTPRFQTENNAIGLDNNLKAGLKSNDEGKAAEFNTVHDLALPDEKEAFKNPGNEKSIHSKLKLMALETASKIWVIGVLFFALYIIIINYIMHHRIKLSSVSIESGNIRNILGECKKLVNINDDIPIVYQKHIKTPAVCGVFKTKMLIPADILDQLGPDEIRYIVLHELCHFKRKDTSIGLLQMLLCIVHWFNPLIWYAFGKMKEDREPICDEMVLSYIKSDERRNYAETLVKMLKYFSDDHRTYGTANITQGSTACFPDLSLFKFR